MESVLHILIVDDDREDRSIITECFRELGYADCMICVEGGTQLLAYMDNKIDHAISLIVLDLNMPLLNGTETLRRLKDIPHLNKIPVVIFSTSVNEIEKSNCMSLGAQDYITKPTKWDGYMETCQKFYDMSMTA